MRNYQLVLILRSELTDAQRKKTIDSVKGFLKDAKIKEEDWGKKTLAYRIKREDAGYYINFLIETDGLIPADLEKRVQAQDEIIRHLLIRKKEGKAKKVEEKEEKKIVKKKKTKKK